MLWAMVRNILFILFLMALPFAVMAKPSELFAVQVGSYKHFEEDAKKSVRQYGKVHVLTYKNLSRVTVGEFTDRKEATALLKKLRKAGFKDAFVRQIGYVDLQRVRSDIEKFNLLISDMDALAFYLDGVMYLFQGNGYIQIPRYHERNLVEKEESPKITHYGYSSWGGKYYK